MTEAAVAKPIRVIALTRRGTALAARISSVMPDSTAFAPTRFAREGGRNAPGSVVGFDIPAAELIKSLWRDSGGFFLVMASGIAVRSIAPLLFDKKIDPAVVVLDQNGRFAVPILSGHLGGANDLARELAEKIGCQAVITTATDTAGAPALEVWARQNNLAVEGGAVKINAAWASGDPVCLYVDPSLAMPPALNDLAPHIDLLTESINDAASFNGARAALTHRLVGSVGASVYLRPRCLTLGVGCHRGIAPAELEREVRDALTRAHFSSQSIKVVATVESRGNEPAVVLLAQSFGAELQAFSAKVLSEVLGPTPAATVARLAGTPSVSEAAAIISSGGGALLLPKIKGKGWTMAVALMSPNNKKGER